MTPAHLTRGFLLCRETSRFPFGCLCAAGSRPRPTERRNRSGFPQTPRGINPRREACMPPLQTPGIASMTSGTGSGGRFAPRYRFCIVTALGLCVGAAYMPPAKWYGCWVFTGCGVCILPCRAGVHARRTNQYFKFFNVRRAKSPALQSGVTGRASRKPRAGRTSAAGLDPAAQGKAKALPMGSKRLF